MAYYQQRGSVPPKRHTQHRAPDGTLYYEELMGEEGFFSDSSLLYHRCDPVGARRRAHLGAARPADGAERAAAAAAPAPARTVQGRRRRVDRRGDRTAARARQRRRADQLRRRRPAVAAVPQRDRRRVRLRRVRHARRSRRSSARSRRAQGDYVLLPRATTHRWVPDPTRRAAAALLHRGEQPHHPGAPLPVEVRPAARARAVLRARPARPGRPPGADHG